MSDDLYDDEGRAVSDGPSVSRETEQYVTLRALVNIAHDAGRPIALDRVLRLFGLQDHEVTAQVELGRRGYLPPLN